MDQQTQIGYSDIIQISILSQFPTLLIKDFGNRIKDEYKTMDEGIDYLK